MIGSLSSRGIGAAALAAGLLLAGCSSDSDVPPTVASAPDGGTQVNTDTGSGGSFPDVNSVPTQRPTSTIQDLNQAPQGLAGAQGGTHYGEPLVGGPTSSAAPPPPPPPPEPPQEQLPPNPESGIQTQSTDSSGAPSAEPSAGYQSAAPAPTEPVASSEPMPPAEPAAPTEPVASSEPTAPTEPAAPTEPMASSEPTASSEPIATPEVAEPQPMEPAQYGDAAQDSAAPEGQTIQGTTGQPAPDTGGVQAAPMAAAPQQPAPLVATPEESSQPVEPQAQLALSPGTMQTPSPGASPQQQMAASAYGPSYAALAPEAYGVSPPQPTPPPNQAYTSAQAVYRSPYASPPANYGGAPVAPTQSAMMAPTPASYGQPYYAGQPVGLIYFLEGSSKLSSDDREVLKQIAEMQRAHGGVVHVVGHASMGTGTTDYTRHQEANRRVSEARANAVARELMGYGVPQDAIQTAAAGDSQPLYSEAMPSGEAANRRAEVYLSAY